MVEGKPTFEVKSGKMLIADPFELGDGVGHFFLDSIDETRPLKWPRNPFEIVPQGVIYSPFSTHYGQPCGEEEVLLVFRNGDNIAITKDLEGYAKPEDRYLKHFFKKARTVREDPTDTPDCPGGMFQSDDTGDLYNGTYLDIPLGEMIGLEGLVFNPQKKYQELEGLRNQMPYERERARGLVLDTLKPAYAFDVLADACHLIIGDLRRIRSDAKKAGNEWTPRFDEPEQILNVSSGLYACEYHPKWATVVIRKTDSKK